jgi:hypothetical protein
MHRDLLLAAQFKHIHENGAKRLDCWGDSADQTALGGLGTRPVGPKKSGPAGPKAITNPDFGGNGAAWLLLKIFVHAELLGALVAHDAGLLVLAHPLLEEIGLALERDHLHKVKRVGGAILFGAA